MYQSRGATFTIRLKDVIRVVNGDIATGRNLGLDTYPLFDESYRAGLNKKIIEHYWNREIGRETIEDWRFAFRRTMNEIMPPYNKLYETERIKFDPLSTMDIRTVSGDIGETIAEATEASEMDAKGIARGLQVSSSFPQTSLKENGTGNYADSGAESDGSTENSSKGSGSSNSKNTTKNDATSSSSGYTGPASELLTRYRATILNIDMSIVADLNPLFMNIWGNGDTFTEGRFVS